MFVYSLSGLELKDAADSGPIEIEENETTARSAMYQVIGRLFTTPDEDHFEMARSGQWDKEVATASELLPFAFAPGDAPLGSDVTAEAYIDEFARTVDTDRGGTSALCAGAWVDDAAANEEEVVRFYEYFGLQAAGAQRPVDHLVTQCDFLQYSTFKEASAPSPRLGKSYRRAQLDFHDRQFTLWVPALCEHLQASTTGFWAWATAALASFTTSDKAYVAELMGA